VGKDGKEKSQSPENQINPPSTQSLPSYIPYHNILHSSWGLLVGWRVGCRREERLITTPPIDQPPT